MLDNIEQIHDPSKSIDEFIEYAKRIAELPKKMVRYGLLDNKSISKEEAKGVLLSVLPMLKSQKQSIEENRRHQKQLSEDLDKKIYEVKAKLSMPDELYPEDSPNQQEAKALYEEILKALS
jgi:polyhydroxyalkanoate synthesis regulator phasin